MRKPLVALALSSLIAMMLPATSFAFTCTDRVDPKYQSALDEMIELEVIKGNPDGSCGLDTPINRITAGVIIGRYEYGDEDLKLNYGDKDFTFPDIDGIYNNDKGSWIPSYAAGLKKYKIFTGDSKTGNFRPGDTIAPEEAAVIIWRTIGEVPMPDPINGELWYEPTIKVFAANGVDTYDPKVKRTMTKGELILQLYQVLGQYQEIAQYAKDSPGYSGPNDPDDEYYDSSSSDNSSNTNTDNSYNNSYNTNTNTNTNTNAGAYAAIPPNGAVPYRVMVEYLDQMQPAQVLATLQTVPQDHWDFIIYTAYASWVHQIACQANPNFVMNIGGTPTSCAQTAQGWASTLQFTGTWENALQEANLQRGQILIGIKCSTGEIDAGSCGAYAGAVGNYNQVSNNVSQTIINNLPSGACDAPYTYLPDGSYCVPRY